MFSKTKFIFDHQTIVSSLLRSHENQLQKSLGKSIEKLASLKLVITKWTMEKYVCACKVLYIIFILLVVFLKTKIVQDETMRGNQQYYILKNEIVFSVSKQNYMGRLLFLITFYKMFVWNCFLRRVTSSNRTEKWSCALSSFGKKAHHIK